MALEYDSDDIGELDDDAEDTIQGPATVEQFDDLLTEFLEDHPTQDHNHEAGYAYDAAGGSVAGGPVDRAAVAKVCTMLTQQAHSMRLAAVYMLSTSYYFKRRTMSDQCDSCCTKEERCDSGSAWAGHTWTVTPAQGLGTLCVLQRWSGRI